MKRLLILFGVLSCLAMLLPIPTSAQDRGTRVRVEVDVPDRAPVAARPVYAAPVYAEPPPVYLPAGGCRSTQAGCRGFQAGGCTGFTAAPAGCHGRTAGSCYGRQAGCAGSVATGYGFAAPVYAEPVGVPVGVQVGVPVYAVPVRAPVGRAAPALYAGPREAYAAGNIQYGVSLSNGTYATPTGKPPGPGVLGVPGAGFPFDGPVRRTLRNVAGYDPGPAKGTVRAGWVP